MELRLEWLRDPEEGIAFGPEKSTWAKLEILIDGVPITKHSPADFKGDEVAWVVGGMSGLADWIVENWLAIHHEIHTPFPKAPQMIRKSGRARFPSLQDAFFGWPDQVAEASVAYGNELGAWQRRHTLGEAASDIALPSIVMIPEDAAIGVGLDHPPPQLSPNVRFNEAVSIDIWPSAPIWLPRAEVSSTLGSFVEEVIRKAQGQKESLRWANWLSEQWKAVLLKEKDRSTVLRWRFGEMVAKNWDRIDKRLKSAVKAFEEVLCDSVPIKDQDTVEWLTNLLEPKKEPSECKSIPIGEVDWGLPPFNEGYRFAGEVRKALKLKDEPLGGSRLVATMKRLGVVEARGVKARGLFRSAYWTPATKKPCAKIVWATDHPRFQGSNPERFAKAAALGFFLASEPSSGASGAALGEQSRWRPTQFANAFAAELLLPTEAIRKAKKPVPELAKIFGISRTAAEWHVENRRSYFEV